MYFAKNIRYLRKQRNISQEQLADALGYKSFTTIQKWESNIAEPSIAKMHQLAEIFNVDINALTYEDIEYNDTHANDNPTPGNEVSEFENLLGQLTDEGTEKVKEFMQFLLTQEKYKSK